MMPRSQPAPAHRTPRHSRLAAIVSAALATGAAAHAQQPSIPVTGNTLEEITVTAQKRAENLQSVPISVQAFDTRRLEELHVTDFNSVAKFLPSLSFQTLGPSQAQVYFRGVTNGSDGLKTGSQPMVGIYLDEQPVTTIGTSLDVHIYDMERIEALAGPQGTLFGASSMAGTVRYITNKPDATATYGAYDVSVSRTRHGGTGETLQGYLNVALSEHAAIRLVGFGERDAGYIDNVAGPYEVYPTSGIVRDNTPYRRNAYNTVGTSGGRAALKVDINDRWTVTPTVTYQKQAGNGSFGYEPNLGYLNVATYEPEVNDDQWYQSALTVAGKIGNFDLTYSAGYMRRTIDNVVDYSDYSYAYDVYYAASPESFGDFFRNNAGQLISPAQYVVSHDVLTKRTHELRLSTATSHLHWVIGAFYEAQRDDNLYRYRVDGLADSLSITGQPGVRYLNAITRTDTDRAVFTDVTYRFIPQLALTLGARVFDYRSVADGFFGFPAVGGYSVGEALCAQPPTLQTATATLPCRNVDARGNGGKYTDKATLNYTIDTDHLVYATYSTGFRAGGFNRNPFVAAYRPDYLTNYEIGWKTQSAGHTVRFNGALFRENWRDPQYGVNGQYAITEIINAGGARTEGVETTLEWLAADGLTLTGSGTYLWKHELTRLACGVPTGGGPCAPADVAAAAGTKMPVAPALKANATARYEWPIGTLKAHLQAAGVHQAAARSLLADADYQVAGTLPSYTSMDFSAGIGARTWNAGLALDNAFDSHGEVSRYLSCSSTYCTKPYVVPVHPRMVTLQFGQKF